MTRETETSKKSAKAEMDLAILTAINQVKADFKKELDSFKRDYAKLFEDEVTKLNAAHKKAIEEEIAALRAGNSEALEEALDKLKREANNAPGAVPWGRALYSTVTKQPEAVSFVVNAAKIEMRETEKKARNLIIFGVAKSTKMDPEEKKKDDLETVKTILADTGADVTPKDIYRFESNKNTASAKPPPILVECHSEQDKWKVVRMAKNLRSKANRDGVFINRDLTQSEREYCKKLAAHRNEENEKLTPDEKLKYMFVIRDNQVLKITRRPAERD